MRISHSSRIFFLAFFLTALAVELRAQIHFTCIARTGNNMTVLIPSAAAPLLNNTPLKAGDEIGVFSLAGLCGGGGVWTGANLILTVWGDDELTPAIDGITPGEPLTYRIWDASTGKEGSAEITYASGDSNYTVDGIAVLATFSAKTLLTDLSASQSSRSFVRLAGRGLSMTYELTKCSPVSVGVFAVNGRVIYRAYKGVQGPGLYPLMSGYPELTSGQYVLRFNAGDIKISCCFWVVR